MRRALCACTILGGEDGHCLQALIGSEVPRLALLIHGDLGVIHGDVGVIHGDVGVHAVTVAVSRPELAASPLPSSVKHSNTSYKI